MSKEADVFGRPSVLIETPVFSTRAMNDRAWLISECSPRYDNFSTVRQAIA